VETQDQSKEIDLEPTPFYSPEGITQNQQKRAVGSKLNLRLSQSIQENSQNWVA